MRVSSDTHTTPAPPAGFPPHRIVMRYEWACQLVDSWMAVQTLAVLELRTSLSTRQAPTLAVPYIASSTATPQGVCCAH
jgi:hypothetical protein